MEVLGRLAGGREEFYTIVLQNAKLNDKIEEVDSPAE
jgi:hypothetical protein